MIIERVVGNPNVAACLLSALLWASPLSDGLRPPRGPSSSDPGPPKAHRATDPLQDLAQYVADHVLTATDPDDLSGRIDELLDDPEYNSLLIAVGRHVQPQMLRQEGVRENDFYMLVGDHEQARFLCNMMAEENRVIVQLLNETSATSDDSGFFHEEPLSFLTDERLPIELKEALLARCRVVPCAAAISALRFSEVPEWLVHECLERWVADETTFMRFLASMPEAMISPQVIPLEDRLDLDRVRMNHESREVVYQSRLAAARALNSDAPPVCPQSCGTIRERMVRGRSSG